MWSQLTQWHGCWYHLVWFDYFKSSHCRILDDTDPLMSGNCVRDDALLMRGNNAC